MKPIEYHCIKTHKGKFGTFYAGKIYANISKIQQHVVYVNYYQEDMHDFNKNVSRKMYEVVPGLKFRTSKEIYSDRFLYFYDYFADIKRMRREKLKKINKCQ